MYKTKVTNQEIIDALNISSSLAEAGQLVGMSGAGISGRGESQPEVQAAIGAMENRVRQSVQAVIKIHGRSVSHIADTLGIPPAQASGILSNFIRTESKENENVATAATRLPGKPVSFAQANGKAEPKPAASPPPQQPVLTQEGRTEIAPYLSKRPARTVSVQRTPLEITDVFRFEICQRGAWIRIPLFGSVRICTGPETPKWSPEQETYVGINAYRITLMDGRVQTVELRQDEPFTVAPLA
jgi:hypothetical protein